MFGSAVIFDDSFIYTGRRGGSSNGAGLVLLVNYEGMYVLTIVVKKDDLIRMLSSVNE